MTEAEWLACANPLAMLKHLRRRASSRKLRLFAVACCRWVWKGLSIVDRRAIEAMETDVESWMVVDDLQEALEAIQQASHHELRTLQNPHWTAKWAVDPNPLTAALNVARRSRNSRVPPPEVAVVLCRCVFGNPFRPVFINRIWLTPTVTSLATAAYEERFLPSGELDAARLVILADALEEAGCTNADILAHCRQPGPHVWGCWPLDFILGKE
jgi:hypothetical protein